MNLYHWIHLEDKLRKCASLQEYQHLLANRLDSVFPFEQALLFAPGPDSSFNVSEISHIIEINHDSSALLWLEADLIPWLVNTCKKPAYFSLPDIKVPIDEQFLHYKGLIYLPLYSKKIGSYGMICWVKEAPESALVKILPLITNSIIFSLETLTPRYPLLRVSLIRRYKRRFIQGALLLAFLACFIPIHESVIAKAEVIAQDSMMITSALNGTIAKIVVKPNAIVKKGELLFTLDDLQQQASLNEAAQRHSTALQKYLFAYHNAYKDAAYLKDLNNLKAEKDLALLEYQFQQQNLELTRIVSPKAGTILFSDPNQLLGQPVQPGQTIMALITSKKIKLAFFIPAQKRLHILPGMTAKFFSNESPERSYDAQVIHISPLATPGYDNELTYFGTASLDEASELRLGEKGTIKLYGKSMFLIRYMTQSPIRQLRQWLGV